MYRRDVDAKLALLAAVEAAAARGLVATVAAAMSKQSAATRVPKYQEEEEGEEKEEAFFDLSHDTLTTCVATWILSPYVDASVAAEIDTLASLEMK